MICQVAAASGVDPLTVLSVADHDPGLFATWADEVSLRVKAERAALVDAYEAALATAQLTSLHRNEFLASKGVTSLPEVWVPVAMRKPAPRFSPREFARSHYPEGVS